MYLSIILGLTIAFLPFVRRMVQEKGIMSRYELSYLGGFLVLCVCAVVMCLNTYNPDYRMYSNIYDASKTYKLDPGQSEFFYYYLCKLGNMVKLDFPEFRALYMITGLLLMFRFVQKTSAHPFVVMLIYVFTSFTLDIVQIRQFLAMGIVLNALIYLLNDTSKKGVIYYCIGVAIAFSIHASSIVYLLFLLTCVKTKRQIKISVAVLCISILGICILQASGLLVQFASYFLEEDQMVAYITGSKYHNTASSVVKYIAVEQVFLFVLLLWRASTYGKSFLYSKELSFERLVVCFNLIILCVSPLYFFSLQFRRLNRIILLPSFIAYFKMLPAKMNKVKLIATILIIIYAAMYAYLIYTSNITIFEDILTNNYLFG